MLHGLDKFVHFDVILTHRIVVLLQRKLICSVVAIVQLKADCLVEDGMSLRLPVALRTHYHCVSSSANVEYRYPISLSSQVQYTNTTITFSPTTIGRRTKHVRRLRHTRTITFPNTEIHSYRLSVGWFQSLQVHVTTCFLVDMQWHNVHWRSIVYLQPTHFQHQHLQYLVQVGLGED